MLYYHRKGILMKIIKLLFLSSCLLGTLSAEDINESKVGETLPVTTKPSVEIVRSTYELKARKALNNIVSDQIKKIHEQANSARSSDAAYVDGFTLSGDIVRFKDIPRKVDEQINLIKRQVYLLIKKVATDIELNKGTSGTLILNDKGEVLYLPNESIPHQIDVKREKLLRANLKNSVSIRSAFLAFNLMSELNKELTTKAQAEQDRKTKEKLLITQAIYVYEMSEMVLQLLSGLELEGTATIFSLHQNMQNRVNQHVHQIDAHKEKAKALKEKGLISEEALVSELNSLDLLIRANNRSLDAWTDILLKTGKQKEFLANVKMKKDLIAYKKDKAKIQLETLRDLAQTAELRDSIGSLDDIVASVANLDLVILDEETISTLLGYKND